MRVRDLAVVLFLVAPLHERASAQCQPMWLPGSGLPAGADGYVRAVTMWDPDGAGPAPAVLVAGGTFTGPGPTPIQNLAVCDLVTGAWSAMPMWSFGEVTALTVMPNGDLVVASWLAPGPAPAAVVRWDGSAWQQLAGANERVFAMVLASNGDLFVGGAFTSLASQLMLGVARWDGASWHPLGGGLGAFAFANAMAAMPNGDVVVGGYFGAIGGPSSACLARWNGTAWSSVGSGLGVVVASLLVLPNGDLLAANTNGIARWNGVAWTMLGSSPYFQPPFGAGPLAVLPDGDVLAGGYFAPSGPSPLLRWEGSTWTPLAAGGVSAQYATSAPVPMCFAVLPDGDVVVGGTFVSAGAVPATGIARLRSPCPASVDPHGPGCASSGGSNTLTAQSLPWIGSTFRARGEGLPGLALVSCVYGLSPLSLPLAAVLPQGQPGCDLLVAPDFVTFALCTTGTVDTALVLPDTQALAGMLFYEQLNPFEIDASVAILAVTASNALRMQIGAF